VVVVAVVMWGLQVGQVVDLEKVVVQVQGIHQALRLVKVTAVEHLLVVVPMVVAVVAELEQ